LEKTAYAAIQHNWLVYKLTPISIRELLFMTDTPCDIYAVEDGLFRRILARNSFINKDVIRELIDKGRVHLFVKHEDRGKFIAYIQNSLTSITRSLSAGNPLEKGRRLMALLSLHMAFVYQHPTNDDYLKLQHQAAKNLAYFLMGKVDLHAPLFHEYMKQKNHYIFAQPMISSLFVLGLMKHGQLYSDKEIENLFLASYFKDVGMCSIPVERYDLGQLTENDKLLMNDHAPHSVTILKGRIPLPQSHLAIIENHHAFSLLKGEDGEYSTPHNSDVVIGFETLVVNIMDVVSAMITGRPYRKAQNLYEALELVRALIADKHPQEFRLIVSYFKNFFLNQ
jgi:hypothetical protein